MKRTFVMIFSIVMCLSVMVGCSSSDKEKVIDTTGLVNDVMENVKFKDDLIKIDTDDILYNLYDLNRDEIKSYTVYVSSTGATAEEIAVFEAKNKMDAEKVLSAVKERVDDLRFGFEGYVPEEILSIDNAVIKQEGKYVMLGIGNDYETINEIFDKYIK